MDTMIADQVLVLELYLSFSLGSPESLFVIVIDHITGDGKNKHLYYKGSSITKVAPPFGVFFTLILPLCSSINSFATLSPSPK